MKLKRRNAESVTVHLPCCDSLYLEDPDGKVREVRIPEAGISLYDLIAEATRKW